MSGSWMRKLASAFLMIFALCGYAAAATITQNFDTDPGWIGNNNTGYGANNFGYSATNNVGGSTGEVGGQIMFRTPTNTWTYYTASLNGTINPQQALSATGRFVFNNLSGADGSFELGFFNTNVLTDAGNTGGNVGGGVGGLQQGVAIRFAEGSSASSFRIHSRTGGVAYRTTANGTGATSVQYAVGTPYLFNLTYTPSGSNYTTSLAIRNATTNALVGTYSYTLPMEGTWGLNAFGLVTNTTGTNNGGTFYMDNVQYTALEPTAVPEPSSIVLVFASVLGIPFLIRKAA